MLDGLERALVLAPHTDDGEFGFGGTMARLVEAGCEVRYVAFSIATRSLPPGFEPADGGDPDTGEVGQVELGEAELQPPVPDQLAGLGQTAGGQPLTTTGNGHEGSCRR